MSANAIEEEPIMAMIGSSSIAFALIYWYLKETAKYVGSKETLKSIRKKGRKNLEEKKKTADQNIKNSPFVDQHSYSPN